MPRVHVKVQFLTLLNWLANASTDDDDLTFHQLTVRNNHSIPLACFDCCLTPAQFDDSADMLVNFNPVSDIYCALHLQRKTAHNIPKCILQGKRDHGCDHRRSSDDSRNIDAFVGEIS